MHSLERALTTAAAEDVHGRVCVLDGWSYPALHAVDHPLVALSIASTVPRTLLSCSCCCPRRLVSAPQDVLVHSIPSYVEH